jgi:hypothetical protein
MYVVTFRLLLISLPKLWMQSFSFLYTFLFAGDIHNVQGVTDNSIVVLYFQRGLGLFCFIIFDG